MDVDKLKAWAEAGDAEVMYNLGLAYRTGREVDKDPAEAHRLFERAATAGYAEAMYTVAEDYYTGTGVAVDYAAAVKWLKESITKWQDVPSMQLFLDMCQAGQGMAANDAMALEFLAAELDKCPQNIYEEHPLKRIMIFGTYSEDMFSPAHEDITEYRRLACQVKRILERKG